MSACTCVPCAVFDALPCERETSPHPVHWRAELRALVTVWLGRHPGLRLYDAAIVAMDLGIVDVSFAGADLSHITSILRESQRELRTCPQCDESGADLHSGRTCDSCQGRHFDETPIGRVLGYSFTGERGTPECPACETECDDRDECECGAVLRRPLELELAESLRSVRGVA